MPRPQFAPLDLYGRWDSRLMDIVNVCDYGAIGDGVADDTAAILAAEDAAEAGMTVWYPRGTYLVGTSIPVNSQIRHIGDGHGATILKLKASANTAIFQSVNYGSLTGTDTTSGPHSWAITDMSLDGNKANNTSGWGIRVYGFGFKLERLRVHDFDSTGILSEWGKGAGFVSPNDMMATISDVHSHHNSGDGYDWAGPHDSAFINCFAYNNGGWGFKCADLANTSGAGSIFTSCHSYGVGQTYAFALFASGCILNNCIGEGAGVDASNGAQVMVAANDCSILGGMYFSAGVGSPAGNVRGIVIGNGSNIAGTVIRTKVNNCIANSVVLANDAGSIIDVQAYATSGALYSGTVSAATQIVGTVSGGQTHPGNVLTAKTKVGQLAIPTSFGGFASMGTATLVAGKVQIYTGAITAASYIFLTVTLAGGTTGVLVAEGIGEATDRSAGNWFFVSSMTTGGALQSADTSTFNWLLIEPS